MEHTGLMVAHEPPVIMVNLNDGHGIDVLPCQPDQVAHYYARGFVSLDELRHMRQTIVDQRDEINRLANAGLEAAYGEAIKTDDAEEWFAVATEQREVIADLRAKLAKVNDELHDLRIKVGLLQPEPDWSQAPAGFDCWAMDRNYDPYFYRGKPRLSVKNGEWMIDPDEGAALFDYSCSFPGWAESLRQRPK